jgi:hypothetical protein
MNNVILQHINRKDCARAGVHIVPVRGIHGSEETGAYSVCLSGRYVDNKDDGEVLCVYLVGVCSTLLTYTPFL